MTLDQQIAELKREIALRKNVYRKWVAQDRMRQSEMDHHMGAMTAALHTVMAVKRLRQTMVEHFPQQHIVESGHVISCTCGFRTEPQEPEFAAFESWLEHVFERSKAATEAETTNG